MAIFKTFSGNAGAFGWDKFRDYSVTSSNNKSTVMTFDTSKAGTYDPTRSPFEIIFTTKKVKFDTDDDGDKFVASGNLVKITYKNVGGDKIGEFNKLKVDWSVIDNYLQEDQPHGIDELIFGGGNTFTGVDNTLLVPSGEYTEGDNFRTGWGNDKVFAKGGNDYITDRGGKDVYDGGTGSDTLSYDEWYWNPQGMKSGITARLDKGWVKGPDGLKDTIVGIEQVRGTFRKDNFVGDKNDNTFMGMNGADTFDGGLGFDMLRYDRDESQGGRSGIRVDLAQGTVRDGFRKIDNIKNIEGIRGTDRRDIMKDDAKDNFFDGRGGNDIFTFTRGDDSVRGRDGFDTFIFKGADVGDNSIRDFTLGEDKIEITSVRGMSELTITISSSGALVEFAEGSIWLDNIANVTADFFNF